MEKSEIRVEDILNALEPINEYFSEDAGSISFVDFIDNHILVLSISGSCSRCRKNNKHLKHVIKEMIHETLGEKIDVIKYVSKRKK